MDLYVKQLGSFKKKYKNKQSGFETGYLTKKEMKELYPDGDFQVVGQLGVSGADRRIAVLHDSDEKTQGVYRLTSSMFHSIVGYIPTDDDRFVAVKRNIWYVWLLFLLLLVALVIGGVFLGSKLGDKEPASAPTGGNNAPSLIDGGAGLIDDLSLPEKIDTSDKNIVLPGIVEIHFKSGTKEQHFLFTNPKENPCFFQIDLFIVNKNGEQEKIYSSDLIPPGYGVQNLALTKPLEKGEYKAVVLYNTFSFDKQRTPLNKGRMNTTIVVE